MRNNEIDKHNFLVAKYTLKKHRKYSKKYHSYINEMTRLLEKSKETQLRNTFNATPTRTLKKYAKGVPIKRLEELGFIEVGRLSHAAKKLSNYRGIGPKSEARTIRAIKAYKSQLKKSFQIKFNPDQLSRIETNYLGRVTFLYQNREIFKAIDSFSKQYLKSYIQVFRRIKRLRNPILKLFMFGNKESMFETSMTELEEINETPALHDFEDAMDVFLLKHKERLKPDIIKQSFKKNAAQFYSIIEANNQVEYKYVTGMPEDLLQSIRNTEVIGKYFTSELRKYQKFAVQFAIVQKKVMIGDEMGLGKTIEALAYLAHLKSQGSTHFLVISPASVMVNWSYETQAHTQLTPYIIHGSRMRQIRTWKEQGGVAITTYGSLAQVRELIDFDIDALVMDEAHYIKNYKAMRTQLSLEMMNQSQHLMMMTGTPLENRLNEFITLLGYLDPNMRRIIHQPDITENPDRFKYEISPRYLRRNRNDVLSELPAINQVDQWVDFTKHQEENYVQALGQSNFMHLRRVAWLSGLTADTPKMLRLKDLQKEALNEGRKVLVFSYFLEVIEVIHQEFSMVALPPLTGNMSSQKRYELIEQFEASPSGSMMIAQINAGGTGLNIQTASMVVLCEPQLKPSTEEQAISRVYRMGQTKDVIVYRILTRNSIDESLMNILKTKQFIFNSYAKKSHLDELSSLSLDQGTLKKHVLNIEKTRFSKSV